MKKAISTIDIPVLNIKRGDTIAVAKRNDSLTAILMAHSGYTFFKECIYVDAPGISDELAEAMGEAFNAGLELGYARVDFKAFMGIFEAQSQVDIDRAMATCRHAC